MRPLLLENLLLKRQASVVDPKDIIAIRRHFEVKASEDAETIRNLVRELVEERKRAAPTITNNNINNINIQLITYGNEPKPPFEVVHKLLQVPSDSIAKYLELKHFGDATTSNMRINKRRPGVLEVYERDRVTGDSSWVKRAKREAIDCLIDRTKNELVDDFYADRVPRWRRWAELLTTNYTEPGSKKNQKIARKELAVRVENSLRVQKSPANPY